MSSNLRCDSPSASRHATRLTLEKACEQVLTTARVAEKTVYQEDTHDALLSWSLHDLRALTHAVRETFAHLQTEEDLFTGKADLWASEHTAEDVKCMLSILRETSRKLAIVLAAALCDPNDNRMSTGGIQDTDAGVSDIDMLLKILTHRAAANAFHDSKLSELMRMEALVKFMQPAQASAEPIQQAVPTERPHVNVTNMTAANTSVEALSELTQLLAQLQTETRSTLERRTANMHEVAAKKCEAATLHAEAIKLVPLLPQHVLRVGLGHGPHRSMDQLVRRPPPVVATVGIGTPLTVKLKYVEADYVYYESTLTINNSDVPHDQSWDTTDGRMRDYIVNFCTKHADAKISTRKCNLALGPPADCPSPVTRPPVKFPVTFRQFRDHNDLAPPGTRQPTATSQVFAGISTICATLGAALTSNKPVDQRVCKSFTNQVESAFREIAKSRAAAAAAANTKAATESTAFIFALVDYETVEKVHRQVEETRDSLRDYLHEHHQSPHQRRPLAIGSFAAPPLIPSTPPNLTDQEDTEAGSDGSFEIFD